MEHQQTPDNKKQPARTTSNEQDQQLQPESAPKELHKSLDSTNNLTPTQVLSLQRTHGNQFVHHLISRKPNNQQNAKPSLPFLGMLPRGSKSLQRDANAPQSATTPNNNTGLPDHLKAGVESLSGLTMDDVHVHYNSSEPDKYASYAYTEGTDIHLGAGQERHLPHEAWHVVQQKQGRVNASLQLKSINANFDSVLEREADVMGARANDASILSRLPSASQAEHSSQLLGQRSPSGKPVRQFKPKCCGGGNQDDQQAQQIHRVAVDMSDRALPPATVPKVRKAVEDGQTISPSFVDKFNLEPISEEIVTTYVQDHSIDVDSIRLIRQELATVLYRPKSVSTYYHATKAGNVDSILASGLDPSFGGKEGAIGTAGEANAPGYIYLAFNPKGAEAAFANFFGTKRGMAILEVTVDTNTVFVSDPDLASAIRTTNKLTNVARYVPAEEVEDSFSE